MMEWLFGTSVRFTDVKTQDTIEKTRLRRVPAKGEGVYFGPGAAYLVDEVVHFCLGWRNYVVVELKKL